MAIAVSQSGLFEPQSTQCHIFMSALNQGKGCMGHNPSGAMIVMVVGLLNRDLDDNKYIYKFVYLIHLSINSPTPAIVAKLVIFLVIGIIIKKRQFNFLISSLFHLNYSKLEAPRPFSICFSYCALSTPRGN